MDDIQLLILQTPSLVYLKLASRRQEFDSAFNGSSWEQFIQTNLSSLATFKFFFSCTLRETDVMINIDSLLDSFRTSFWLNNIHSFVTCDYSMQHRIINLYTMPMPIAKTDSLSKSMNICSSPCVAIRWTISSMNVNCSPTLNWTDGMFDVRETEVLLLFNNIILSVLYFSHRHSQK
jgi:hypothetical protein